MGDVGEILRAWSCSAITEVVEGSSGQSIVEDTATLGRFIFNLPLNATVEAVRVQTTNHFGCNELGSVLETDPEVMLEALLICAVSDICAAKNSFIQCIMSMEPKAQAVLMLCIKNQLADYLTGGDASSDADESRSFDEDTLNNTEIGIDYNNDDDDDIIVLKADSTSIKVLPTPAEIDNNKTSSNATMMDMLEVDIVEDNNRTNTRQSLYDQGRQSVYEQGRKTVCIPLSCNNCTNKDNLIESLRHDIETNLAAVTQTEGKLKSEIAVLMNKIVDIEVSLHDKVTKLGEKDAMIAQLGSKIKELEETLVDHQLLKKRLLELQDEIDVLKPQAERAEGIERQYERLREKLDELNGVKHQLNIEVNAHEETHRRLLLLEQEVETLRKAKQQLEEYRIQQSESVIQIEELTYRLREKERELHSIMTDTTSQVSNQQGHLLQSQYLMEELQATTEQLREIQRNGGVGTGLSELNPVLMQELNRLRSENECLAKKLDQTSLDSLDKLEKELGDQKCVVANLQAKWMATKDSLASALVTISLLNAKIQNLEMELAGLRFSSNECQQMYNEELSTIKVTNKRKIAQALSRHEQHVSLAVQGQRAVREEYAHALDVTELALNDANNNIASLTNDVRSLESSKEALQVSLQEEQAAKATAIENHNAYVQNLVTQGTEKINSIINKYTNELNQEKEMNKALTADVEEERLKRRRVEREKKFHEAEAHRYKTQLHLNSSNNAGASSIEIGDALKEIKQMQALLDAANEEIDRLKKNNGGNAPAPIANTASVTTGNSTVVVRPSSRPGRVKVTDKDNDVHGTTSTLDSNAGICGYLEQSELMDKRVEQLTREKREIIAKNLEENKEKVEFSQKLLAAEKEIASLKTKITKVTLEKERIERKYMKDKENHDGNAMALM